MRPPPVEIPLLGLDLHTPDRSAPDGTLRVRENMCYVGPSERHQASPVEPPVELFAAPEQVVAAREFIMASGGTETLLWVVVTAGKVYSADPSAAYALTQVYDFGNVDATRKAQFAFVGGKLFVAVSKGAGVGAPEALLAVISVDGSPACIDYNIPDLPVLGATLVSTTDEDALTKGFYAYRYAYLLRDGSFGPLSRPYILDLSALASNGQVRWVILSYPDEIPAAWQDLIQGVAIFLCPKALATAEGDASYVDAVMNSVFHHVTTIPGTGVGSEVTWADASDSIAGYPSADDESLLQHRIVAASSFAYNQRLILGDVAYDLRPPTAPFAADSPGTEPPVISSETDSPGFQDGAGQSTFYRVESLQRFITTIEVTPPAGFMFKIRTGSVGGAVASDNVDYSNPASADKVFYVELIEDGIVTLAPGTTVLVDITISATDAGGYSTTQTFHAGLYRP